MKSNNTTTINNWIKIAEYDLATAKAMYETRRYIYVVFMCEQCIEKLLKALFVKQEGDSPPYTHNLIRLVELTGLENELKKEKQATLIH